MAAAYEVLVKLAPRPPAGRISARQPFGNLLKQQAARARRSGVDEVRDENVRETGQEAIDAAQREAVSTGPFFWRVASGVTYAEMPLTRTVRPPLLTPWESERVQAFRNRERRNRWLAGRALAKVLVKDRLGIAGMIEIREGSDGEPLVYEDGFPRPDVWLGIVVRHGRIACVLADRPVSLDVRCVQDSEAEVVDRFLPRGEQRILRKAVGSARAARSAGWAIKEAAQRAVRRRDGAELAAVGLDAAFGVHVGDDQHVQVMALRVVDDIAVAIVGRFLLEERAHVRIVLDAAAREEATPRLQAAIERSVARARRISDARHRWSQARPEPT